MNDPKRQEIKDRIAAEQEREDTRGAYYDARTTADQDDSEGGFIGFAKQHPYVTAAAGVAIGVLIAGMFPSARNAARKGSKQATALGAAGTQVALSAIQDFLDSAEDVGRAGSETLSDWGNAVGDTARSASRDTRYLAEQSADSARIAARDTGKSTSRLFSRLWS